MPRPVVALLTDFGGRDHYVGTMKGVILGICPDVTLVDITHEIEPQDVLAAALELAAAHRYFPAGTIFLVVVDPGVGSSRRAVAVEAGEYRFIAPDNGVLGPALAEYPAALAVELSDRQYARPAISRTFEGRDRFAPAAGWLAKGVGLSALGAAVGDLARLAMPRPTVAEGAICGEVLRVDRFGNLVTNIDRRAIHGIGGDGRSLEVRAGGRVITGIVTTYADVKAGEICALFGSTDQLEIAANGGSAAVLLEMRRGAPVHLLRRA